jgi:Rrf2 family iron-sulfur cluster assembly transcriptional regulator
VLSAIMGRDLPAMRLTTKGRYAVTAMLDLALHHETGPVTLGDIAQRQGISLSYLEQLFARLRRRGLVDSTRGPGGGYRLGRHAQQIAVADVIWAVDESVDATRCGGLENCQGEERCLTHDLWQDLSHQIHEFLCGIDLAQLVERRRVREVAARQGSIDVGLDLDASTTH